MSVLPESGEVFVDAQRGLGKIGRSVVDGNGQMAEFRGQPSGFVLSACIFLRGKLFPAVAGGEGWQLSSQEADGLLFGERQQLDAIRDDVAGPVQLPGGNKHMATWSAGRQIL